MLAPRRRSRWPDSVGVRVALPGNPDLAGRHAGPPAAALIMQCGVLGAPVALVTLPGPQRAPPPSAALWRRSHSAMYCPAIRATSPASAAITRYNHALVAGL